jgi:hypothetical protein
MGNILIKQYTHASDNLISYINYSVNADANLETKDAEGSLIYKEGNLVKEQQTAGSLFQTKTYEFDAKNNPLKNVLGFNLLLNEISEFGKNNVLSTTVLSAGASTPTVYVASYVYNDKGYPTKSTSLTGGGKSVEYEIEYSY